MSIKDVTPQESDAVDAAVNRLLADRWLVVGDESTIGFKVRKMGMYDVKGRFGTLDGHVHVTRDRVPHGGEVIVDAASVSTRMPPRDRHLRGRDFLAVADHPSIRATVDRVVPGQDGALTLPVLVKLHGVERFVELSGHLHATPEADVVVLHVEGSIDRHDFGIRARRPFEWVVGREVRISADLYLRRDEQGGIA